MGQSIRTSPERLSDLIGAVYDCVLAPEQWTGVIDAIRAEFNFFNAVLAVNGLADGSAILNVTTGIEPHWLAIMGSFGGAVLDLWGGPERIQKYPLEEPIVQSRAMPELGAKDNLEHMRRNRYFAEWAQPQGIMDAVVIGLERSPTSVANLAMGRHGSAGEITGAELDGLRLIAPHLRRAVAISQILELRTIEIEAFAATLETFKAGIVLVADDMRPVHANGAAAAMLAANAPIQVKDGRIVLSLDATTAALGAAVREAASGLAKPSARGVGIPARQPDGLPAVVHVLPLRTRRMSFTGLMQRATAALVIAPTTASSELPRDALALIYSLTPAEARVLEMIAAGHTQTAIAAQLSLSVGTVKTQLLRVFDKTGCRRQADLVKLAASLTLPL